MRAFYAIERAGEVERPLVNPRQFHQFEIFGGAPVTFGLRREIAVAFLLVVGLTSNDMDGEPAAAQVIEGGDFASH